MADPSGVEAPLVRPDTATTVVLTMRQLGVIGLPRNYELFYEAVTTGNKALTDALSALGGHPTQKQLDEVAQKFLARDDHWQVANAHGEIATKLDEILSLLRRDRSSMETYDKILGETSSGLSGRNAMSREFLDKIIAVVATATRTSIENRRHVVSTIEHRSEQLHEVQSKLEEYKRLADTDALTQVQNRRAFDRAIAGIYDDKHGVAFCSLIVADIDRFKSINDRFGHPVGDRILQIVGGIIRAVAKDVLCVARTGGEEFAVILEGSGEEATTKVAEDIRRAIAEAPFVNVSNGANYGPITISLGTCMASQASGADDLYVKADRALYASKTSGRNRVTRYSSLSDASLVKNWLLYKRS